MEKMKNVRLNKYLNDMFGQYFVEQNEINFTKIEDYLAELQNALKKHADGDKGAHSSSQIRHDVSNVQDEINKLKARVTSQVVGKLGDNAEISDARSSIDGKLHKVLDDRLDYDFTKINSKADHAKDYADKHEGQISNSAYYDEVTYTTGRKFDTSFKIVHIPHKDKEGNLIKLKRGIVGDDKAHPEHITARDFASRTGATYVSNASTGSASRLMLHGKQILDGKIIQSVEDYEPLKDRWTLTIGEDNTLYSYPPYVSQKELIAKGVKNTVSGFGPLIMDGAIAYDKGDYSDNSEELHPRQVIGQLPNKDLFFFSCDGRGVTKTFVQRGMKLSEVIETLQEVFGKNKINFAYNLDGGGSSSSVLRSRMLNKTVDNNNKSERKVLDFLYVGKEQRQPRDADLQFAYEAIGEARADFQFLYGTLMHFNLINSKELNLMNGDTGYAGIVLRDSKGVPMTKLYLDDRLAWYDYKKKKSLFIADENSIQHNDRMLGHFYSNPEPVSDCNNIRWGGRYQTLSTSKGAPYPNLSSAIITHDNIGSRDFKKASTAFQTATPFARSAAIKCKRRTWTKKDGWSQWFDM